MPLIGRFKAWFSQGAQVLRGRTARNVLVVTGGNFLGQGIAFFGSLVLMRRLGPSAYGRLGVALAVFSVANQLSDIGINTGFIRYMALFTREDPAKGDRLLRYTLWLKTVIGGGVMLLGVLVSPWLAVLLKAPSLAGMLRWAFLGSFTATLLGTFQALHQAKERFGAYVASNVEASVFRVILILLFMGLGALNESTAISFYAVAPFLALGVLLFRLPRSERHACVSAPLDHQVGRTLMNFSKWVTLSTLSVLMINNVDTFLLQRLSSSREVGLYTSAWQLAMIFPLVSAALTSALAPRVSSYVTREEMYAHLRKVKAIAGVAVIGYVALFALSNTMIHVLMGPQYVQAGPIFNVLLLGFMLSLALAPINVLFFALDKPSLLAYLNLAQLIIIVALDLLLIPAYGGLGAAIGSLIVRIVGVIYTAVLLSRALKRWEGPCST